MSSGSGTPPRANAEQVELWNSETGPRWVKLERALDAMLRDVGLATMDAARVARGEQVLDVGCGCGDTCLELARRVGPRGLVVGVDISRPMLERARERVREAKADNVRLEVADAQVTPFGPGTFDVVHSRFGLMFFEDPAAAFRNLRRALRPGGRLATCAWSAREKNPWLTALASAVAAVVEIPTPADPHAPGPFGLHDGARTRELLSAAGFAQVEMNERRMLLQLGGTLDEAVAHCLQLGPLARPLAQASDDVLEVVTGLARGVLGRHVASDGAVRMQGAAWIVTAVHA
jgi:SAM-dependent methyltransferase